MDMIPEHLPTVVNDRAQLSWQELGVGEMMISMEMEFDAALDEKRLARAFDLLLDAQPVLGCRIQPHPKKPYWVRLPKDERGNFFTVRDDSDFEKFRNEPYPHLTGPQVVACLRRTGEGDRLLVKVSHIVCDAGGVKELVADAVSIYNRLATEPDYMPVPNITGSRGWDQVFRLLPWRAFPLFCLDLLGVIRRNTMLLASHTLPLPACPLAPMGYLIRHIPADRTARIAEYGRTNNATINDMLVTAFIRAMAAGPSWDGRSHLRLTITVDLRRWNLGTARAEGICNLSAFEFPSLERDPGVDFLSALKRISAFFQYRKTRRFGLPFAPFIFLFSLLSFTSLKKFFGLWIRKGADSHNNQSAFTNMGPIKPEEVTFNGARPARAWLLAPPATPPWLAAGVSGYDGTLTLSAGTAESLLPMIEPFFDKILAGLPA